MQAEVPAVWVLHELWRLLLSYATCEHCGRESSSLDDVESLKRQVEHWKNEMNKVSVELARLHRRHVQYVNDAESAVSIMSGRLSRAGGVSIDEQRWRSLAKLCHPDKHNNSEDSNEVTKWLISIRQE